MVINMNEKKLVTLDQLREFLAATQGVGFQGCGQDGGRHRHIEAMPQRSALNELLRRSIF